MSTNNFCYENRCVIVPDDMFGEGDDWSALFTISGARPFYENRSYSRSVLAEQRVKAKQKPLYATQVVITAGYYGDSCIDYIQDEDRAFEYVSDGNDYKNKPLTDEILRIRADLLLAREARLANRIINRIKIEYKLTEVKRVATFSNGEAVYKKIGRRG